jgi:hypothetical protein
MTRQQSSRLLLFSLPALVGGVYLGFALWFAPGWANVWPGLPQREVCPAGLTALAFLGGMCLVVGFEAAILSRFASRRDRVARSAFASWLLSGWLQHVEARPAPITLPHALTSPSLAPTYPDFFPFSLTCQRWRRCMVLACKSMPP